MSWLKNIWSPKRIVVIYINLTNGEKEYSAVKVDSKSQDHIEVQIFDSLDEIMSEYGKNSAFHLHTNGNGVLSRKIEHSSTYKNDLILGGNVEDFIFCPFSDGVSMAVSFCRKELIQEEIVWAKENKIHLLGFSCGETTMLSVLKDEAISFDYELAIKNNKIDAFKRSDSPRVKSLYKENYWTKKEFISYSISKLYSESNQELLILDENSVENYKQFQQFRTVGLSSLALIFVIIISVFFYQNKLNQDIVDLEYQLSAHTANLSLLDKLKQEKERKQLLISNAGINSPNFLTQYLNDLGKSVPKNISLDKLALFPIDGKVKDKQKIEVKQNEIFISGLTKNNQVVEGWIESLNRFSWVRRVELLSYVETSDEPASFELIIEIN